VAQNPKFALDNPTYDLIAILHEKSKALEAFDKYLKDFQGDNEIRQELEKIRQDDFNHVQTLERHLQRRFSEGVRKAA
jgi:hypothetical protein